MIESKSKQKREYDIVREAYNTGRRMNFSRRQVSYVFDRIDELERQLAEAQAAPPVITAYDSTAEFLCGDCKSVVVHTMFSVNGVTVRQCALCNKIAAVV